jgi:hypothetical protein
VRLAAAGAAELSGLSPSPGWGRLIRLEPGWGLPNYRGVPIPAARHPVWTCTWLCAASAHPRLGPFLWAGRRFKNRPLLGERSSDQRIVLTPHWDIPVLEGGPDRHIAPVPRRVSELERPQPSPAGAVSVGTRGGELGHALFGGLFTPRDSSQGRIIVIFDAALGEGRLLQARANFFYQLFAGIGLLNVISNFNLAINKSA